MDKLYAGVQRHRMVDYMTYSPIFSGNSTIPVPASQAVQSNGSNTTGSTITQLTPVYVTSSGVLAIIDPSVEADVQAIVGIAGADIVNGLSGNVASNGRILNITNSYPYGTQLYLSKTGGVTPTQPSIGVGGFVAGDFVVSLGVVVQNNSNHSEYDFIVRIDLVGQL